MNDSIKKLSLLEWQLLPDSIKNWTMQGSKGSRLYTWIKINGQITEVVIKDLEDRGFYEVI